MQPVRFVKTPEVVNAMAYDGTPASAREIATWAPDRIHARSAGLLVRTPDGWQDTRGGEWVVQDALGAFAVYPDRVFAATFGPHP